MGMKLGWEYTCDGCGLRMFIPAATLQQPKTGLQQYRDSGWATSSSSQLTQEEKAFYNKNWHKVEQLHLCPKCKGEY